MTPTQHAKCKTLQHAKCKTLPVLALFLIAACGPAKVMAHGDITNELLTDRSTTCGDYADTYSASVRDVQNRKQHDATVSISSDGAHCQITSNAVPNHDFNATGHFANAFRAQTQIYTITATPKRAAKPTPLTLRYDNAVFLNGVKLDLMAAGCFGVRDGKIGCNDALTPYRYDPMAKAGGFGTDEHNAHTQPDGTYHYHGNPMALFEQDAPTGPSPVIGFAADGFPIFGSYIEVDRSVRKATSSYQLKSGSRPSGPGGSYDGTFVDDWVYVAGSGDLDACNGMMQDGVYGYVVTDAYPHVLGCFTGTPDASFQKKRP